MSRRIKRINVLPNQILNLFAEPRFMGDENSWCINDYYIENLPEDAKVIGITYDISTNSISLFIHSKSFEEIPQYAVVPIMEMTVKIIKKEGKWRKEEPYQPLF